MSNFNSGNFLLVPKVTKHKSRPKITRQARVSKQHTELRKSTNEDKKIPQKTNYYSYKPTPTLSPEKSRLDSNNIIVVPAPPTTISFNQDHNRTVNQTLYKNPYPHPLLKPQPYHQGYGQGYSGNEGRWMPQPRPVCTESRVMMINKACHVLPELQDATQYTNTSPNEVYQALLIEQYGFNPIETVTSEVQKPIEKSLIKCPNPTMENSSQCENPPTTNTGTNGTNIQMEYSFADDSAGNCFAPKNVQISNSPRLKVIAEKFMRYKKDHIEIRQLEERIICVEYDVFCRDDLVKKPAQVMRAYFCVKTGCDECKGALLNNLYVQYNVPLRDKTLINSLETEVEIIDEKLPENKPYLKDLQAVLKKRQAMNTKKQKSTLDLMSMYTMAFNEMSPRDHDWSHTNLLSKAELDEVKHLILKKCESRVHNLSRKKMKLNDSIAMESTNTVGTEKSESLCYNLLRDLDKRLKAT